MIFATVIHVMLLVGGAFSQSPATSTTPTTTQDSCYDCRSPCPSQTPSSSYAVTSAICGDQRLGPTALPSHSLINSMLTNYHNLGRECPQAYFDTWFNYAEAIMYPPQQGFKLDSSGVQIFSNITIPNGTYIDRFGGTNSQYVSPAGVPYEQRSIPPSNLIRRNNGTGTIYVRYVTLTDIEVENGTIAPWFGQPGGGIQYILPYSTETLANPPYNWLERVALV